jgi:nitroreductase
MENSLEPLLQNLAPHHAGYRPRILRLPENSDELGEILASTPGIQVYDLIATQLKELIKSLDPSIRLTSKELGDKVVYHLKGRSLTEYGCWVFYPWSKRLVHLLDEEEFAMVRTDRNRNKITREEQQRLSRMKVGVIGLSVGQSVSMTMALERSFGEIRLADFDTLDLSNLNRLRTGVHHLGLNKVIVTAREIAELDPYLKVTCFTAGLAKENMDVFFTEGGNLDILVEECDSVDIKILARQKAKALGIPVVMDMSDRGCLDVERFDLEPQRPLMHGWIGHLDLEAASRPMTSEEKMPYMAPITGIETLSPRMKASVIELNQSISTWPQLATSVALGGALAGDAARRIALDQFHASGRWFVDLDELVSDPTAPAVAPRPQPPPFRLSPKDLRTIDEHLGPASAVALDLGPEMVQELVKAGGLAPSSGNMQPWKFLWHERRLLLFHDVSRSASFWDPDHFIAHIALGACTENVVLKAHALGLEVVLRDHSMPGPYALAGIFEFHDRPVPAAEPHAMDHLATMIGMRCTNRKITEKKPFPPEVFNQLGFAVSSVPGCTAQLAESPEQLSILARLCGSAERIRLLNPIGHEEFFGHELKWAPDTPKGSKEGLDLASMELSASNIVGLKVASDRRAMDLIDRWGAGKGLEEISGKAIRSASAVILVSTLEDTHASRLKGGRAVERLWMAANAEGFTVHPVSAPIFMSHMLSCKPQGLRDRERAELEVIRREFRSLWALQARHALFMVRLSRAGEPSLRALRRPVSELLLRSTDILHPIPAQ